MHPTLTTAEPKEERPSRPRPDDRGTRAPMAGWDRCKIIILLLGVWARLLTWADKDAPIAHLPRIPLNIGFLCGLILAFALFFFLPFSLVFGYR